jgi:multiple sugar transport system ATP-binding protein
MGLEVRGVQKAFAGTPILTRIDLSVGGGECVVVLGPSGCGKSTFLRIISGLEAPDAGTVSCNGEDFTFLPARQRNVALVFQHYALYEDRTVFENLAYPLRLRKMSQSEIEQRVSAILAELNLTKLAARRPPTLSGGEQQRVALGRALVREPTVFLLDEPLSSLDPSFRHELRIQLQEVYRSLRVPTIHVTHDQEEAMLLGDRIAVLLEGEIQQCGPVDELIERPASITVAQFLGSPRINVIECEVRHDDGCFRGWLDNSYSLPVPISSVHRLLEGSQRIICGIRPWNLRFTSEGLRVKVRSRRYLPPHLRFEVQAVDRPDQRTITVISDRSSDLFENSLTCISVNDDEPLWFDYSTGSLLPKKEAD